MLNSNFQIWTARSRGHLVTDWLDARLTLNFGGWRSPGRECFGPLRVLNDDRVMPLSGFDVHQHRDLEILVVPLTTSIEHRDSEGRHQYVRPGQIQWMRAGSGIAHSQMNASANLVDRHLQLWVEPRRKGLKPNVQVHNIGVPVPGQWTALNGQVGGLFEPDAAISLWLGRTGRLKALELKATHARLLQVVEGEVQIADDNGLSVTLHEGDTLVCPMDAPAVCLISQSEALLLCADLPCSNS